MGLHPRLLLLNAHRGLAKHYFRVEGASLTQPQRRRQLQRHRQGRRGAGRALRTHQGYGRCMSP